MILQALCQYYERSNNLPREGWIKRAVDYVFVLEENGVCTQIEMLGDIQRGKTVSTEMVVPNIGKQALKHTNSGNDANLLWDNASFVFGTGVKGMQKLTSFLTAMEIWLPNTDDLGVLSVKKFCESIKKNPVILSTILQRSQYAEDFERRDPVLSFRLLTDVEGVHARPNVVAAYESAFWARADGALLRGNCLISGAANVPIARNETVIKGVAGGQTSGANVISFNERTFESYGKTKRGGENAPISTRLAFRYTTALNHLLRRDSTQRVRVADTTVVFWADRESEMEAVIPNIFGESDRDDPSRGVRAVNELFNSIHSGKLGGLKGDIRFHVLGLSPNAARISVRFYHQMPIRDIAAQIQQYFQDLRIVRQYDSDSEFPQLNGILAACGQETSDPKRANVYFQGRRYVVPPQIPGDIVRSVFTSGSIPLPATLLNAILNRCRAEQAKKTDAGKPMLHVSYLRAAALKGYLNRWVRWNNLEERTLDVALDIHNTNQAYRLGRLFAAYERIQTDAAGRELNRTIRDTFFSSAMATPAAVFPRLVQLNLHHMRTLKRDRFGLSISRDKLVNEILWDVDGELPFPSHLTMPDQGRFAVGYYHQRQAFFVKTEKTTSTIEGA